MPTKLTQKSKAAVWGFWQELNSAEADDTANVIQSYVNEDISWHGPHPINDLAGVEALLAGYWQPLAHSFPDLKRRTDILIAGQFDGKDWVTGIGYFSGTFAQDWLGIPATSGETYIRFGEFCAVQNDKIVETYIILDLLDVMRQAGFDLLPSHGGVEGIVPPPETSDGVLLAKQDEQESLKSLELVEAMLSGLMEYDQSTLSSMGQVRFWDPDMMWYGPSGIGTTTGLKGFEDHHQRPFLKAFPDRKGGDHKACFGDGLYAASTGWPSLYATHRGEYLGVPATGKRVAMRVMDWWRREGDLLVENWVLIDMIDLLLQLGVDLFERLPGNTTTDLE